MAWHLLMLKSSSDFFLLSSYVFKSCWRWHMSLYPHVSCRCPEAIIREQANPRFGRSFWAFLWWDWGWGSLMIRFVQNHGLKWNQTSSVSSSSPSLGLCPVSTAQHPLLSSWTESSDVCETAAVDGLWNKGSWLGTNLPKSCHHLKCNGHTSSQNPSHLPAKLMAHTFSYLLPVWERMHLSAGVNGLQQPGDLLAKWAWRGLEGGLLVYTYFIHKASVVRELVVTAPRWLTWGRDLYLHPQLAGHSRQRGDALQDLLTHSLHVTWNRH